MSKLTNLIAKLNTLVAAKESVTTNAFSVNRKDKVTAFCFSYKEASVKIRERAVDTFITVDIDGARSYKVVPETAATLGFDSIERAVKYGSFDNEIAEVIEEVRGKTSSKSFFSNAIEEADTLRELAVRPVSDNWVSELPKKETALDRLMKENKEEDVEIF